MGERLLLYNACYYDEQTVVNDAAILLQDGMIEKIYDEGLPDEERKSCDEAVDCSGMLVLPAFVDGHLHLPSAFLYEKYGLDLRREKCVEDYVRAIRNFDTGCMTVLRGYGWENAVCEKQPDGYQQIRRVLDHVHKSIPAVIFSSDYHSCICNQQFESFISDNSLDIEVAENGFISGKSLFLLLTQNIVSFDAEQIKDALLFEQKNLISKGITSIQSLMFLGGNGTLEWETMKSLEVQGQWLIKTNIAASLYPFETIEQMLMKHSKLMMFESKNISANTVKIYMDGVVENRTAYLLENYAQTDDRGRKFWDNELFRQVCCKFDSLGVQIHIHAIGDAAVKEAVDGLCYVMDINRTKHKNRHVITHLQLIDTIDIRRMKDYGIVASIQPYWIPKNGIPNERDVECLGDRAYDEYRVGSLFSTNVIVASSSDSPVTENNNPLIGIEQAVSRTEKAEKTSVENMIDSFTKNGAYQLGRDEQIGRIKEGFCGDLAVISKNICSETMENAYLTYTIINGKISYRA